MKLTSIALFGDESGSHSTDSYVSIGIVISTQPSTDNDRLLEIKKELKCTREVKYSKTDRLILPTCKAWMNAFMSSPSLHFRATVLRPRTQREYLSHRYRSETAVDPSEKLYNKHYCNLIRYCRRDLNKIVRNIRA